MNLNSLNIQSLSLFNLWTKVEYLSLKDNLIKDLSFLPYFPMLFYLDISNNSIEDFDLFNTYNLYGYLSLTSPSNFLEKKILTIRNLNVGILNLDIKNETYANIVINNPNILLFNGTFYSYNEKISLINQIDASCNSITSGKNNSLLIAQHNHKISSLKGKNVNDKSMEINSNLSNPNVNS